MDRLNDFMYSNSTRCNLSAFLEAGDFYRASTELMNHPEQAKTADDEGWTPLHFACMSDIPDMPLIFIRNLIDHSDVKQKDLSGLNAFHHLCENVLSSSSIRLRITLIEMFLEKYPDLARTPSDDDNMYPLHIYLATGSISLLPLPPTELVRKGFEMILRAYPKAISKRCDGGMYPLHYSCRYFIPNIAPNKEYDEFANYLIVELIRLGPKIASKKDDSWRYPLHHLCKNLDPRSSSAKAIYKSLLDAFPLGIRQKNRWELNPLQEFWTHLKTSLGKSVDNNFEAVAEMLMKFSLHGSDVEIEKGSWLPIHAAIWLGCPISYIANLILQRRYDLRIRDSEGDTPLMKSIITEMHYEDEDSEEDYDSVNVLDNATMILVASCPDSVKLPNNQGRVPLNVAIEKKMGWEYGVKMIVDAEPELLTTRDVATHLYPFMIAANRSMFEMCYKLLISGPEVIQCAIDRSFPSSINTIKPKRVRLR